eukprot:TRINITY_DN525_c0_g1_i2.p2 TRINITY_DN525_c0_g1~~TRINITY_DN525_c0_g1_i2.p2  ORF type:complete len:527 (-),score=154.57 TRINITY_DN525_c0_g1_i2:101-1681(-)
MNFKLFFLIALVFGIACGQFYGMDYGVKRGNGAGICPNYTQVKGDLVLMKRYTNIVRLYNLHECNGGNYTLRAAKELGMKVFIGLQNNPLNDFYWNIYVFESMHKELGFMDFVVGAAVGCESLHRNDLAKDLVASRIVDFRNFTRNLGYTFPVGTADTTGGFNNAPAVRAASEIMLINIFAYYSGTPFASATDTTASDNLIAQFNNFKKNNPGKIIEIGETGWPTSESRSNQNGLTILKWHMNQFVCRCWKENISLYWFQSFDQPFKGENQREGTWGIWNDARQIKITMTLDCPDHPYVPTPIPPSTSTSSSSSSTSSTTRTSSTSSTAITSTSATNPPSTSSTAVESQTKETKETQVVTKTSEATEFSFTTDASENVPETSKAEEDVKVQLSIVFSVSFSDFDSAKFVRILATLLDIPESRIRIVSVTPQTKRQENTVVTFEILPSSEANAPTAAQVARRLQDTLSFNSSAFEDSGLPMVGTIQVVTEATTASSTANNNLAQSFGVRLTIPSISFVFGIVLLAFL